MTPSLPEATRVFARIGVLSFGGPAAQIALMHKELVERQAWLGERDFLGALSFCMLLPGPEAMQLATYAGWRLHGVAGGLIAGLLFVLPGALIVAGLSALYLWLGALPLVAAIFLGVKATVVVIVIEALLRVARKALGSADRWIVAGLAFLGIYVFALPFPLIVLAAGLYGALTATTGAQPEPLGPRPRTARTVAIWAALWAAPLVLLWAVGADRLLAIGLFFSKLAVVTFGGAYAVLAYMTQAAVEQHGWLTTGQMMDGLGLAETTPGPLILVTEFVGILAGNGLGGPVQAALAGLLTLWVTFTPCFLWIFAGAPYLGWISGRPRLTGALQAITAAVVGVILNLSVWFAMHVFFTGTQRFQAGPVDVLLPVPNTLDPYALALAAAAGLLLLWRHWPLPLVLALAAAAGGLLHTL